MRDMTSIGSSSWKTWTDLGVTLDPSVLSALSANGFVRATPVQSACIPLLCATKDVAAEAVTGSGKTLAFLVPILEHLLRRDPKLKDQEVGAIVISPTRELALQTHRVLQSLLQHVPGLTSTLLTSGSVNLKQAAAILNDKGANILVSTPGRLDDLFGLKDCSLSSRVKSLEVLILDEADRLLELGFQITLNRIFTRLPKQRRTGLFSATQTEEVESVIRAGLRNPVRVVVKEKAASCPTSGPNSGLDRVPSSLDNFFVVVEPKDKLNFLIAFLKKHRRKKIMVFFSTCASVEYFGTILKRLLKSDVTLIHGKRKKGKRGNAFETFRTVKEGVLACTDVMARGVDFPDVDWVLQFDPPSAASAFVHRCGRTARIGAKGSALLILLPNEECYVDFLRINQKAPVYPMPEDDVSVDGDHVTNIRSLAKSDRTFFEKGMRSFVSFVQSYTKHECRYLLKVTELDLAGLATGFGLIRMPKMPEMKGMDLSGFLEEQVDMDSVPYVDADKERRRQEKLCVWKETGENPFVKKKRTEKWSETRKKKEEKKTKKEERKEKKKGKRKVEMTDEDLKDLADDIRLMKKLKKGKIRDDDFEKEFMDEEEEGLDTT